MKTRQLAVTLALTLLALFIAAARAEKAPNEHTELITAPTHTYNIKLGGTLDEFNTPQYIETYLKNMRQESKFQPNKYLTIENIGDTDIINPRIIVNGRRNWFSADDILDSIFKPDMTDAEKAMAIYSFLASHEVQAHENDRRPGPEVPEDNSNPSRNTYKERANPVKSVNSYYCGGCQYEATNFAILCQHAGLAARAVWLNDLDKYGSHCVGEVFYDGDWHLFDPDQRTFYLDADNTNVASYEKLHQRPSLATRTHDGGFASEDLKDRTHQYERYFPPHVMNIETWVSTMAMTLRPGEKFIYRWDNIGKYRGGKNPRNIRPSRPQGLLPHQLANGKIIYQPKLADAELFQRAVVSALNIKSVPTAAWTTMLQPQLPGWPAFVIYKVTSPYPIVGGKVGAKFFKKTNKDKCKIYISVHDSDWIKIWSEHKTDLIERKRNLDDYINPLPTAPVYEYYLKFEVQANEAPEDAWMSDFHIETDVQTAATSLPALSTGENKIVYRDDSGRGRKVKITHGWTESSETVPPSAPPGPARPKYGGKVKLKALTDLAWKPAKDPDGRIVDYHIQVSARPDFLLPVSPNFDRIINSDQPQWNLPQGWLVKGRTYYWRIRSKDDWGAWSNWSNVWKFKVTD